MLYCKDLVITLYLYINGTCTLLLFGKTNVYKCKTQKSDGHAKVRWYVAYTDAKVQWYIADTDAKV